MSEANWFLIWRRAQQWTICLGADDGRERHDLEAEDAASASVAATIAAQLLELGYAGQPIVLGLPSERCLAARIPMEKKQRDYQSLLFALEEKLPLAAEEMVADFVFSQESNGVLGVAVELKEIQPLLDELERHEVFVTVLCPTSFLALQNVSEEIPASGHTICLWQQDDQVECFVLEGSKLSEWSVLAVDKEAIRRQLLLASRASRGPAEIATFALDEQLFHDSVEEQQVVLASPDRLLDRAARQADRVAAGRQSALVDLRNHELAAPDAYRHVRGLLQALIVVGFVFLIGFCLAVHWRANQYQDLVASFERRQSEVFERTFPGQKVPMGIRSRLESERTKLSAVAGQSAELPKLNSELETLRALLEALPDEVQFSWDRIRLDSPGQIVLEGKVLSHVDAGLIVDALTDGGFEIEVPQSEQLPSQLVSVRIRGGRSDNVP